MIKISNIPVENFVEYEDKYGSWNILKLPDTDVGYSYKAFIKPEYRGKGYGKYHLGLRLEKAREMQLSYLTAYVEIWNNEERTMLEKYGWVRKEIPDSSFFHYYIDLYPYNNSMKDLIQVLKGRVEEND